MQAEADSDSEVVSESEPGDFGHADSEDGSDNFPDSAESSCNRC